MPNRRWLPLTCLCLSAAFGCGRSMVKTRVAAGTTYARPQAGPSAADPIYQPIDNAEGLVAVVDPTRANRDRDSAAARVNPGVASVAEILGIGPLGAPAEPIEGMRVLKSAAAARGSIDP